MESPKERKKQLVQEYKKQPKKMGAYCIRNTESKKCFVGISRDIDARLNRHRFSLRTNTEGLCPELQQDWNNLGSEVFEFSVLDTITPPAGREFDYDPNEDLLVLEQLWVEQLNTFAPQGYNKQRQT